MTWNAVGVVLAAMGLSGCLEPAQTTCAAGQICPEGYACRANGGCALADAVAICDGQDDATACTSTGVPDGVCSDGVCVNAGCGNGVQEVGEVCDDGNVVAVDGCASDCGSTEACGNEVVDPVLGEQCDSGAGLSGDGCASACVIEVPSWEPWTEPLLTAVSDPVMTYDAPAGVVVLLDSGAGTWTNDGRGWRHVVPDGLPQLSGRAALGRDPTTGHALAFIRTYQPNATTRTWVFDGDAWQPRATVGEPPTRDGAAMAFDSERQRLVMFGGLGDVRLADTWSFDGETWLDLAPAQAPSPRWGQGMAYDASRDRIVLSGGKTLAGDTADTWEFDGVAWNSITVVQAPPTRGSVTAAYDGVNQQVVMLARGASQAYAYANNAWTLLPASAVGSFGATAITYNPARNVVMQVLATVSGNLQSARELASGSWRTIDGNSSPHEGPGVAYDSKRGRTIRFGGAFGDGDTHFGDTMVFTGERWFTIGDPYYDPAGPPSRTRPGMVYDRARDRVVLFGGRDGNYACAGDTWELAGDTWSEFVGPGPSKRIGPGMAYDEARGVTVLFGGAAGEDYDETAVPVGDTWEFDGAAWQVRTPATSPPARRDPMMVYDQGRHVIVLHGGDSGTPQAPTSLNDTWQYDGATWTQVLTEGPPARQVAAMAYDVTRHVVALYGGYTAAGASADHWTFDGVSWTKVYYQLPPPAPRQHALVFDAIAQRLIAVGGTLDNDVVKLRAASPYADEVSPPARCTDDVDDDLDGLAGCADPDCWGRCTPTCAPYTSCDPAQLADPTPRCGDGVCDPVLEVGTLCEVDCNVCGDRVCAVGFEDLRNCATDCQVCGDDVCAALVEDASNCPGDCS